MSSYGPGGAMGKTIAKEAYELYEMLGQNSQENNTKHVGMHEINLKTELLMQMNNLTRQFGALMKHLGSISKEMVAQ